MSLVLFVLCLLAAVGISRRAHPLLRASNDTHRPAPDDAAIEALLRAQDTAARRACLLATWSTPWPWWFLGACLAFAGLCIGAGLWQWGTPDAPALLVGGLLFGLAVTFKAWAQTRAVQAQPPAPPTPQSHSRSRA